MFVIVLVLSWQSRHLQKHQWRSLIIPVSAAKSRAKHIVCFIVVVFLVNDFNFFAEVNLPVISVCNIDIGNCGTSIHYKRTVYKLLKEFCTIKFWTAGNKTTKAEIVIMMMIMQLSASSYLHSIWNRTVLRLNRLFMCFCVTCFTSNEFNKCIIFKLNWKLKVVVLTVN